MKTKKQFLHTIGENLKFGKNNDRIKIYQTAINERESPRNKHHIVKMIVSTNDKKTKPKKKGHLQSLGAQFHSWDLVDLLLLLHYSQLARSRCSCQDP